MKRFLIGVAMAVAMLFGSVSLPAFADIGNICDGPIYDPDLLEAAGCSLEKESAIPVAVRLIEVVLSVVGILAVVMIVIGGIFYVISAGDAVKIQRAKNTILYAVVGLAISLLAYTIVYFVSQSIWG